MTLPTKVALHLVVLGVALVTVALRPVTSTAAVRPPAPVPTGSAPAGAVVARTAEPHTAGRAHRHRTHRPRRTRHQPARPAVAPTPHRARTVAHRQPTRHVTHHAAHHRRHAVTGPTGWSALDAAIARIPTYHAGESRWVVSSRYGHWGTADWYHDVMYISPSVPTSYLYDVAVHEWSHELSVLDYGADVDAAVQAMDGYFGGSGLTGAERAADCMAILQGATWTHYTTCDDSRWRAGAARLIRGERL